MAGRRRHDARPRSSTRASTTGGVFVQHYGAKDLDASNLLIPIMGFLPPATTSACAPRCSRSPTSSPRTAWCCATASTAPTTGSPAKRARSPSARSGWCRRSPSSVRSTAARALFEKLLSFAGPLHLYAEEIDVTHRPAPRELPAGVHPPRAHRRRPAPDRGRAGGGVTHRVVVVGGGFGGLPACRYLGRARRSRSPSIDRRNHHLFQPLLYQVATGILSPGQIAPPLRHMLRKHKNVKVELAEVDGFDLDRRVVMAKRLGIHEMEIPVRQPDRRRRRQPVVLRPRRVRAVRAGHEDDRRRARAAPAHLRCVRDRRDRDRRGGAARVAHHRRSSAPGPTGVEIAGQVRELASRALRGDFRTFDPTIDARDHRRRWRRAPRDVRPQPVARRDASSSAISASSCASAPGSPASTPSASTSA